MLTFHFYETVLQNNSEILRLFVCIYGNYGLLCSHLEGTTVETTYSIYPEPNP